MHARAAFPASPWQGIFTADSAELAAYNNSLDGRGGGGGGGFLCAGDALVLESAVGAAVAGGGGALQQLQQLPDRVQGCLMDAARICLGLNYGA